MIDWCCPLWQGDIQIGYSQEQGTLFGICELFQLAGNQTPDTPRAARKTTTCAEKPTFAKSDAIGGSELKVQVLKLCYMSTKHRSRYTCSKFIAVRCWEYRTLKYSAVYR